METNSPKPERITHDFLEKEIASKKFLKTSIPKYTIYLFLSLISFGIIPLIVSWTTSLKYSAVFSETDPNNATYVLIVTPDNILVLCSLHTAVVKEETKRFIIFRFIKYFLNEDNLLFSKINFLNGKTLKQIKESLPLSTKKEERRRMTSGENSLRTPVTPILTVLMREILGPFNVYQLIACIIWIFRDYALYSTLIIIFMVIAIIVELVENRMSQKKLR